MTSLTTHNFHYLLEEGNNFMVTRKKEFKTHSILDKGDIEKCIEFAYDMRGKHREYRSGGLEKRSDKDILLNAIQGKFSEFGFYNYVISREREISYPDLEVNEKGIWDSGDFTANNKSIAIKSTKNFGNLLLLEQKDWDFQGRYIPDIGKNKGTTYDFIYLVRVCSNFEELFLKYNRSKEKILENIDSIYVKINKVGYITYNDLVHEIIDKKYIIPQGAKLNGKKAMDATNYYVQADDLR